MKRLLQISFVLAAVVTGTGVAHAQNAEAGKGKVAMCQGCHSIPGYQASFPEVYKVPMIAGQNAKYIVSALTAYAKGDRKHPTMRGIAGSLSEADMADVAAYYESLGKGAAVPADAAPTGDVAKLLQKGACTSCHGADPRQLGRNAKTGRPIDPVAVSANPQRYTDTALVEKHFQRDCKSVMGRPCSAQESGDYITFMMGQ